MNNNALLIISLSARSYVEAAKLAGFYVTAIDGFVDQETQAQSDEAFTVDVDANGFNATKLMNIVSGLEAKRYIGCLFGAGFESQPTQLNLIAEIMPVLGNAVDVIAAVKNPQYFFQSLSDLNVKFPALQDLNKVSPNQQRVIQKKIGGSGGEHISWVDLNDCQNDCVDSVSNPNVYHQAYLEGQAISVLLLVGVSFEHANAPVAIIGFNEQWTSADEKEPFKFGGIVSHVKLQKAVKRKLGLIVQQIVKKFDLIGLNSLDVIVDNDEIYVLEVNPRLSASLSLYLQDYLDGVRVNLLQAHVDICAYSKTTNNKQQALALNAVIGDLIEFNQPYQKGKLSKAFAVVYAENDCMIDHHMQWPEWAADLPRHEKYAKNAGILAQIAFKKGEPICSVVASGVDALVAKASVNGRVNYIKSLLNN